MGDYVGKDNAFDVKDNPELPLERYCDWNEIMELVNTGCYLGWHTWSHKDLTTLSYDEVVKEITPPFPMATLAYPYGRFNDVVIEAAKAVGFEKAYSVTAGDNSPYQITREYL